MATRTKAARGARARGSGPTHTDTTPIEPPGCDNQQCHTPRCRRLHHRTGFPYHQPVQCPQCEETIYLRDTRDLSNAMGLLCRCGKYFLHSETPHTLLDGAKWWEFPIGDPRREERRKDEERAYLANRANASGTDSQETRQESRSTNDLPATQGDVPLEGEIARQTRSSDKKRSSAGPKKGRTSAKKSTKKKNGE